MGNTETEAIYWIPEEKFINELCHHKEMPNKSVDDICQVLYHNGMIVPNKVAGGWRHVHPLHPEQGFFYLLKQNNTKKMTSKLNTN